MYRADRMAEQANVGWILLFDCSEAGLVSLKGQEWTRFFTIDFLPKTDQRRSWNGQLRGQHLAQLLSVRTKVRTRSQLPLVFECTAQCHLCHVAGTRTSKCQVLFRSKHWRICRTTQFARLHGRRTAEQPISMASHSIEVDGRTVEGKRRRIQKGEKVLRQNSNDRPNADHWTGSRLTDWLVDRSFDRLIESIDLILTRLILPVSHHNFCSFWFLHQNKSIISQSKVQSAQVWFHPTILRCSICSFQMDQVSCAGEGLAFNLIVKQSKALGTEFGG